MKSKYGQWTTPERMNYVVYYPDNYSGLPLLIYLHGAGERGLTVEHLTRHGVPRLIAEGREIPAVVLCPQCPAQFVWDNVVSELKAIIDHVVEEYQIERDRICITGSSMGGFGTWAMAATYRSFFSAAAPVAGGGLPWCGPQLVRLPIRAYSGDLDEVVPVKCSEMMVEAVKQSGGTASMTYLHGFGHNDGIYEAYANTDLIDWLLAQRRTDFSYIPCVCEEFF